MNNFELHEKAIELSDTLTPYALARRILENTDMVLYALKVPFLDDYMYLTEGGGNDVKHRFFDTFEEVKECQTRWKGSKIVEVTFKEYEEVT